MNSIEVDDFFYCAYKKKILEEIEKNHVSEIICYDSTNSTTLYDFLLVSLLMVDISINNPYHMDHIKQNRFSWVGYFNK